MEGLNVSGAAYKSAAACSQESDTSSWGAAVATAASFEVSIVGASANYEDSVGRSF